MDKETLIRKLHEVFECNDILTSKYKLKVTDTYKLCTTIKTAKYSEEYLETYYTDHLIRDMFIMIQDYYSVPDMML